jgi:probable F420-dependent oxidoreductase
MDISAVVGMWLDRPPEEALHTAVLADRLGYGELWLGETGTWDAFALATAVGLATDSIALTVGPLPVAVRDPAMIAMGAASVTALTRRRVGVALGTSNPTLVEDWHGRSRAGAADALEGSVRAVATLLGGGRTNGVNGYRLRLGPPEGPLTVAALGDRAIAAAAAHADRMVINLVTPGQAAGLKERLDAAAKKAGRPAPRLAAWMPAAVDPVPESYAQLIWGLVPYLNAPGYSANLAAAGFADAVRLARAGTAPRELLTALPLELAGTIGLAGDLAAVRSRRASTRSRSSRSRAATRAASAPSGRSASSATRRL